MKKLSIISTATALAAIVLAGCNPTGSGSQEVEYLLRTSSTEQTVGGSTTITRYTWNDETAAQTGEEKRVDGRTVYDISNYEFDDTSLPYKGSRIRTSYDENGTSIRERLVTTYGAIHGGKALETKYEEFLLGPDGDESVPVRYSTTTWAGGQVTDYKQYDNGGSEVTFHQYEFQYKTDNSGYSYKEKTGDGEAVAMFYKVTERDPVTFDIYGFERYSEWDGSTGNLVEKMTDYEWDNENKSSEYKFTRYDAEGNETVINVEDRYKSIMVTYNF